MLLGHLDGGVFLLIFAAYLIWMIGSAKKARAAHKESQMMREEGELVDEEIQILPLWKCALFIVGGMIAIKFGGDFVVDSTCKRIRTQSDTYRTYHRCDGNQSSGTCNIDCCGKKE